MMLLKLWKMSHFFLLRLIIKLFAFQRVYITTLAATQAGNTGSFGIPLLALKEILKCKCTKCNVMCCPSFQYWNKQCQCFCVLICAMFMLIEVHTSVYSRLPLYLISYLICARLKVGQLIAHVCFICHDDCWTLTSNKKDRKSSLGLAETNSSF